MIDGKLSHEHLTKLLLFVAKMNMRLHWKIMLLVPSLRNFRIFSIITQRNSDRLNEFDIAALSLQTFGSLMLDSYNEWNK